MPLEPDLSRLREIFVNAKHASGLTYDELAERSGLGRQTLVNLASGKYRGDLRTWLLLARTLDAPMDELLAPVWETRDNGGGAST